MPNFENKDSKSGFTMKLWRGERMSLIGFDVNVAEPDLVGFAIECRGPGQSEFHPLLNRIAFSYDEPITTAVTGARLYSSLKAPFQKFRWVHFPPNPKNGTYTYRGTKMHMPQDDVLVKGTSITLGISLAPVTYDNFLDVGFTRGFASSQAFRDKFDDDADVDKTGKTIIPTTADAGIKFKKAKKPPKIYEWMGFEAYDLLFEFLDSAVKDKKVSLDVFTYDFNEPDILKRLKAMKKRLRIIIDDSKKTKNGKVTGHGTVPQRRVTSGKDSGKVQGGWFAGRTSRTFSTTKFSSRSATAKHCACCAGRRITPSAGFTSSRTTC